jgi:UDP-GlcNAc3NAcA epimerase
MPKKVISVVGARPQFIKAAPLEMVFRELDDYEFISIHTGQHYDENMSQVFFNDFGLEQPKYQLHVGSASHGKQTGSMLEKIEEILLQEKPDLLIVYGDTNSTLAAALAASKLNIPIAHIEAGLRSYNRTMPEEINRVLTDHVSSLLLVPSHVSVNNLKNEGITKGVIMTGDIMMDILRISTEKNVVSKPVDQAYYYATIHRPYNTDLPERMSQILKEMNSLDKPVYFSIHPRTSSLLEKYGIDFNDFDNIKFIEPQSYIGNLGYLLNAERIITDSGGLQKEAWFVKKPCVTLRPETEWIETLDNQWNVLVFEDLSTLKEAISVTPGAYNQGVYGDGNAADKIRASIVEFLGN